MWLTEENNMSKGIKYIIGLILFGLLAYNSVYFQDLDERLAESAEVEFDAATVVNKLWQGDLKAAFDSATPINELLDQLSTDPATAFSEKSQSLGIGNIGYFKVQGTGIIAQINENNVIVRVNNKPLELETEFIFGNAIRDASGLIKINDYTETSDFNSISEAINDRIRKEVIPDFKSKVKTGQEIEFKGAIELNQAHLNLDNIEVIPISIQTLP